MMSRSLPRALVALVCPLILGACASHSPPQPAAAPPPSQPDAPAQPDLDSVAEVPSPKETRAILEGTERTRLDVTFSNLRPDLGGEAVAAIYADAESFDNGGRPVHFEYLPIEAEDIVWTLDLLPGDYAVKVYQDYDKDHTLDRNAVRIPTEPYGYSNNVRSKLGPASWEEARFAVGGSQQGLVIKIEDH